MESRKYLYVVAASYPFGHAEPFLESELKHIYNQFEKVYIIIPDFGILKNPVKRFWMPENAILIKLFRVRNSAYYFRFYLNIFKKSTIEEIYYIKHSYKLKFRLQNIKTILSFAATGDLFGKKLEKILIENGHTNAETTIYSYWLTDAVWGIAQVKKKFPELNVCSRVHGWDCFFYRDKNNYLPLRKEIINTLDNICPVSKAGRDYLLDKIPHINPDKIRLHYLGVEDLSPVDFILFTEGKLRLVSIAYVHHVKRLHLLIEALSIIDEIEIEWTHIGAWSDATLWHKQYAIDLLGSKKNVKFTILGELSILEVRKYLDSHNADFLINVSESEGLPVSMMESLAAGVPVISTAVGGVPEIITHKINGFLMPQNPNVHEIAEFLSNVSKISDKEYKTMAINARNDFEKKWKSSNNFDTFTRFILKKTNHKNNLSVSFRICTKCIIDNIVYPEIVFDNEGVCDVCHSYDKIRKKIEHEKEGKGEKFLANKIQEIKEKGIKKKYDCILGLSGGVDSSYLLLLAKEWGLRPLVLHVDNGWNTETAVSNILKLTQKLNFDLETYVVNWEELRDLELSYMKASVVDIDIPNEMCSYAVINRKAAELGLNYILTGHNHWSEGWLPPTFSHYKYDTLNLNDIHRRFGTVKLKTYPKIGYFRTQYYKKVKQITMFSPLDYMPYNKEEAKKLLISKYDWVDYGGKHFENSYTRFYQSYILPAKFNLDKRKAHLSFLICSGQLTREQAMEIIEKPPYLNKELFESDRNYFIKKLGISESEFENYIEQPPRKHTDYKSYVNIQKFISKNLKFLKKIIPHP